VPKEYIPGVLKGLEESMTSGNLAGFPVVDVTTTLIDGSYHEVDSSALAFQIAARGAFREAMQKCGARLLEPVMKVRREADTQTVGLKPNGSRHTEMQPCLDGSIWFWV